MLNELKSKLKELAELRRDIQISDEYIAERKAEYETTCDKAVDARLELSKSYTKLAMEMADIIDGLYNLINEGSDLSQYLD